LPTHSTARSRCATDTREVPPNFCTMTFTRVPLPPGPAP
jgi:hypothetical protein